jgi:iron complex outermembrane receptor protein
VLTGKINDIGAAIMTNVPESYRFGIETQLAWRVVSNLDFTANLTISKNKINNFTEYIDNWNYWDDPENEPYQYENELGSTTISFSPSMTAGAQLNYHLRENFDIIFGSSYVSRQFIDNTSNKERSLDPYLTGNLQLKYKVKQPVFKVLEISAILNNLFNTKYETNAWVYRYIYDDQHYAMDGYFPQAGRHGLISATIRF